MGEILKPSTEKRINQSDNFNAIDIGKFVAAILVMFIHCKKLFYNEVLNLVVINIICRYAVPFFFVATGFFFFRKLKYVDGKIEKDKENFSFFINYEKRIVILYLVWSAVYCGLRYYDYCKNFWGQYNFIKDFLVDFTISESYYHMWYLLSMIFAVPVIYFLLRFIKIKYVCIITLLLYIVEVLVYGYNWIPQIAVFSAIVDKTHIFGVALLRTVPLILIGLFCLNSKLNFKKRIVGLIVCVILNVFEILMLYVVTNGTGRYSYIFTTLPLAFFIFGVVSEIKVNCNKNICIYLRKSSTIVYCIHPLVYFFIERIEFVSSWINFCISLAICMMFASIIIWLSSKRVFNFLKYLY